MAERGAVSGIEYHKDFDSYKKLLITKANNKHVKEIYKFYNKIVFSSISKPTANNQENSDGDDDAMELAFQGLDEDTDVELDGPELEVNGSPPGVRGRVRGDIVNEGEGSPHEGRVAAATGGAGTQYRDGNVSANRAAAAGSTQPRSRQGESGSSASRDEVAAAVIVGEGGEGGVAPEPTGRPTRRRQPVPSQGKSKTVAKGKGKAKAAAKTTPVQVQDPDEMMDDEFY
jgi:hypothetical protein